MRTVPRRAGGAIPWPFFYLPRGAGKLFAVFLGSAVLAAAGPVCADDTLTFNAKVVHASWYGHGFARRPTASGQLFDPNKLTGAHRTLPMGTRVRVTNLHNGRSVLVTINDRGPYVRPRELDLSYGAARRLGMIRRGVARVRIEPI